MIWGLTLEPGKMYTRVMGDEIQLSMASLESRTDYDDERDGYSHVVMKTQKSEYLLCTLVHGLTFQQNLDLKLRPNETVSFSVQGSNVVYLMGYSMTDSEVDDQIEIDIEAGLEEDSMNEMLDFEEGDLEELETPRDHSGPEEGEKSVAMAGVELRSHGGEQLESRDLNAPCTSRGEVQIEINRPDEFSTEESPSVNMIKLEETEGEEEEAESNISPRILVGETTLEEPEDVVPTGIQRNQIIQGHTMNPRTVVGPQSSWTDSSFETYHPEPQPVLPEVGSFSSKQIGEGKIIPRVRTATAHKHVTPQKTNWNLSTTRRSGNQPSGDISQTKLLADALSRSRNQASQPGNATQDTTKPYPVVCPLCRVAIRGAGQFQVHLRSHTGEKPFRCSHCEKSFSQVQNRDRHERTHTGARPFHCRFCNRTFTQSHHRKKHELQSHGELWTLPDT